MADVVDRATRSRMMSAVRRRDTGIEVRFRSELHRRGLRFRKDAGELPGRPDVLLPSYGAAVFVHGCFWHGHDCPLFRWPSSNVRFWKRKITGNRQRDAGNVAALNGLGWRVLTVWECALRGRTDREMAQVISRTLAWLRAKTPTAEIRRKRRGNV